YWEEEGSGGIVYGFSNTCKATCSRDLIADKCCRKNDLFDRFLLLSLFSLSFCNLLSTADLLLAGREIIV
ncbi:hypothetical protein SKAU_G00332370, partial [Synaphobranchus kaupii]